MLKLSKYCIASEPFGDFASGDTKHVLLSGRTGEIRVIGAQGWDLLSAPDFSGNDLPGDLRYELMSIEALVPEQEDELTVILDRNRAAQEDTGQFYLVIQPTASCQLGCGYCGQAHTSQKLDDLDTDRLVTMVSEKLETGRFEHFQVGWFGAEPLNALSKIYELSVAFEKAAAKAGCSYGAKVVTNGMKLTVPTALKLAREAGVRLVEITLDGDREFHDKRRFTKKNQPSFDRIYGNLLKVATHPDIDFQINIRANVDEHNVEGVFALIDRLASDGLQERIRFYTAPVHSWGNDAHLQAVELARYAKWELNCLAYLVNRGFRSGLVPNRKNVVCMAAMKNGLLVDAYGEAFDCTEVSYVPAYGSDNTYKIGTLAEGIDANKRKIFSEYLGNVKSGELPCASCEILPICGGSCPKQWNEGLTPCPPTKLNIRGRLLLHYCASKIREEIPA
ncbi:radical SAM/SPASM domain-containing protein [Roseibium aquae]|uniref:Radical SAM/SPASM domain-containing protein n=1 Tax=Roseibium aquae TaxID=1323746 RepID=A0A916TKS5_9HYPH|nr:radical SAM protein [Roseibium aquae]GGB50164.1 radical SAM/SPASM domain-containing protein [Roseibium aquae]